MKTDNKSAVKQTMTGNLIEEYKKSSVKQMKTGDLIKTYKKVKQQADEALDILQWSDSCEEGSLWANIYNNAQGYLKIIENELSYRRIEI